MTQNRKMPIFSILKNALFYCGQKWQFCGLFSLVFYALGTAILLSWQKVLVWPLLVILFLVWGVFFRVYFNKRPYFSIKTLANSLIPSTKIVLLTVIIATFLFMLPLAMVFIDVSPEFNLKYTNFIQTGSDLGHNDIFIIITQIVFVFILPIIFYRPFLAWISSLIGRSGSLKLAWDKTKGNYIGFLTISLLTYFTLVCIYWLVVNLSNNYYIFMMGTTFIIIYFNVVAAMSYQFFFLINEVKN